MRPDFKKEERYHIHVGGLADVVAVELGNLKPLGLSSFDSLGSRPIDQCVLVIEQISFIQSWKEISMSDLFWLSDRQFSLMRPHFPLSH